MDAALNRKSLMFGIPGILLQFGGPIAFLTTATPPTKATISPTGYAIAIAGTVLLIIGLGFYAKAKGHSGWLGLLGLLSWLGLLILAFQPDNNPNSAKRT